MTEFIKHTLEDWQFGILHTPFIWVYFIVGPLLIVVAIILIKHEGKKKKK